ncbi:Allergen Tha p 2 [Pseudolycoriella hygida]|uniref:Allergen Tha p 2 n=1 Tax=Pseudolycoriella hygida TaxID=35572 RepID=A0A9Q0MQW8_9DIPT|nr:Allergen Tha p 2 [Pseudolycoriella hygida]
MRRFIKNWLSLRVFAMTLLANSCYGVTIDIDTSQAPDLANFGNMLKKVLIPWYPIVSAELASPNFTPTDKMTIIFDINYAGIAVTNLNENKIVCSVKYYRRFQDDVGSLIHEMTHIIQNPNRNCPIWIIEGVADWFRYYKYEPSSRMPSKPQSTDSYMRGYGVTAYFLQYVIDNTPQMQAPYHMVYWVNKDCREGTYNDSIWPRLTGKTLSQLWQDMLTSPKPVPLDPGKYGCYLGYCWSWCYQRNSGHWCYTTKVQKNDKGWVQCKSSSECNENWQCAGECYSK